MPDDIDTDAPASEQFDLTAGMDFDISAEEIHQLAARLKDAEAFGTAEREAGEAEDEVLAEYIASLKMLENAAEEARKEVFEPALDDRVDVGDSVGPVQRLSGSSSYVHDAEGAFAAVADAGADPLAVADVKVGALRDVLGSRADEFVGQSEYSYYRREG